MLEVSEAQLTSKDVLEMDVQNRKSRRCAWEVSTSLRSCVEQDVCLTVFLRQGTPKYIASTTREWPAADLTAWFFKADDLVLGLASLICASWRDGDGRGGSPRVSADSEPRRWARVLLLTAAVMEQR